MERSATRPPRTQPGFTVVAGSGAGEYRSVLFRRCIARVTRPEEDLPRFFRSKVSCRRDRSAAKSTMSIHLSRGLLGISGRRKNSGFNISSVLKFQAICGCFLYLALGQTTSAPIIVEVDLNDIVHPVSAAYVRDGINHAKQLNARAVILRLDTPVCLGDSMRHNVVCVLFWPMPVITWVGPNGARAASAGFFILLAGDVAVMAPGTNAGAAHPVSATGQKIEDVMEKKIVSDASAYIRSYTAKRGRNAQLAELGITESRSYTGEEALKNNLIDAVISDVAGIVEQYDGRQIRRFDDRPEMLHLLGATIETFEMTPRQRILSRVLDPNLALILALAGLLGLYVEITHPGLILPGVIGGISLILALFAFNMLPVNWAGAA